MEDLQMTKQLVRPHRMDKKGDEKSLIWEDIYNFCLTLTPDKLKQPVRVWGEEKAGGIYAISEIQDDLINPSGEGLETKSSYANSEDESDREAAEDEAVILPKGTIIFDLDF
jgi:hypothetical protein